MLAEHAEPCACEVSWQHMWVSMVCRVGRVAGAVANGAVAVVVGADVCVVVGVRERGDVGELAKTRVATEGG